ncbi:hypothetical protein TNCV_4056241 [Trichonephila clavipes]|nr:hypothetical protein TNCV_4056241 [Trichonephila clavipes]
MMINFDYFIDIFDDGLACMKCIFNIKNASTESTKPKLHVLSCCITAVQQFLYPFETPCKSPAEDAELGIVQVSQKHVEMLDIQRSVNIELVNVQLSQQPHEIANIQYAVDAKLGTVLSLSRFVSCLALRLFKSSQFGLWKHFVKSKYFRSSSFIRALGKIRLTLSRHNS